MDQRLLWLGMLGFGLVSQTGCTSAGRACGGAKWAAYFADTGQGLRAWADSQDMHLGAAIACPTLGAEEPYGQTFAMEFNSLTAENVMKWGLIHPEPLEWRLDDADALVSFAKRHDMTVKGHALVWHEELPDWVDESLTPEELDRVLVDHIETLVDHYEGRIRAWDVVNEAIADDDTGYRHTLWYDKFGPDFIPRAFELARNTDPNALLFYNDYGTEGLEHKSNHVYDMIKGLVESGAEIDGVGMQMHLNAADLPNWDDVRANFARLGELGLEVAVTELDVRVGTIEGSEAERFDVQKGIYKTVIAICLESPYCNEVSLWGFTDAHTWIDDFWGIPDDPLPFDENYQPKPAYDGILSALGG